MPSQRRIDVFIEAGQKRVFASAIDWMSRKVNWDDLRARPARTSYSLAGQIAQACVLLYSLSSRNRGKGATMRRHSMLCAARQRLGRLVLMIAGISTIMAASLPTAWSFTTNSLASRSAATAINVRLSGLAHGAEIGSIQVQLPWNGVGAPKMIHFYTLETTRVTGSVANLPIPRSRALTRIEVKAHGTINLMITVVYKTTVSRWVESVHPQSSGVTNVRISDVRIWPTSPQHGPVPPAVLHHPTCPSMLLLNEKEVISRIGRLSVAKVRGASATFTDTNTADNTVSVGFQTGTKWTADGSATVTNSIGTTGTLNRGPGYHNYLRGHIYLGEYLLGGKFCTKPGEYIWVTSSVGDVTSSRAAAPGNPWGNCARDPHGDAFVGPNGSWGRDRSRSSTISGSGGWMGFTFGQSNGFTTDVNESWQAGRRGTYVCGNRDPVQDSGVFWNSVRGR
jgi:hypothetical protein